MSHYLPQSLVSFVAMLEVSNVIILSVLILDSKPKYRVVLFYCCKIQLHHLFTMVYTHYTTSPIFSSRWNPTLCSKPKLLPTPWHTNILSYNIQHNSQITKWDSGNAMTNLRPLKLVEEQNPQPAFKSDGMMTMRSNQAKVRRLGGRGWSAKAGLWLWMIASFRCMGVLVTY